MLHNSATIAIMNKLDSFKGQINTVDLVNYVAYYSGNACNIDDFLALGLVTFDGYVGGISRYTISDKGRELLKQAVS